MQDIVTELLKLGKIALNNLSGLSILVGFFVWMWSRMKKRLDQTISEPNVQQDAVLTEIVDRLDKIETDNVNYHKETNKNILRIQIEDGIYRRKFSESEVLERYDRYSKDYDGNGYISNLVKEYVKSLHEEEAAKLKGQHHEQSK